MHALILLIIIAILAQCLCVTETFFESNTNSREKEQKDSLMEKLSDKKKTQVTHRQFTIKIAKCPLTVKLS